MSPITRWRHDSRYLHGMLLRKRVLTALVHGTGLFRLIDAVWVANRDVRLTRHRVVAPIPRPVRLALVSDLHVVRLGIRERRVLEILERERPDVIALNGDFNALGAPADACGEVLARMHAPLGMFATLGNWDYGHPVANWRSFLAGHGVRLLTNEASPVTEGLWVAGLDDALVGWPDADAALASVPPGVFVIGLIHCPVLFDDVATRFPLVLAGHTHGGQIRIPGLRPLYLPRGCWPYVAGWYERDGSRMYVSRGLGSPGLPIRIACPPEVALFELGPA
jgi:predicted MPP superfamily phosphohydrolase